MLSFLPGPIRCALAFFLYTINTFIWIGPLLFVALLKFLIPLEPWQKFIRYIMGILAVIWISINNFNLWLMHKIDIQVTGIGPLEPKKWYVVLANHQSWVDILIMQKVFIGKIPFLKFFLKKELIWIPILGIAWWALEFPFMKRYSRAFLKKYPHLAGKDIESTRKACQKFKTIPVSVVNYMEGTRFSLQKHKKQNSPFQHLLRPKAGGIAFVLGSMGEIMTGIVDTTIVYPDGAKGFWAFLNGKLSRVRVHVRLLPITNKLIGNYFKDDAFRARFQEWVNEIWWEKDARITKMLATANTSNMTE